MLQILIIVLFGISGGALVGTSAAAFITLLDIVPRLAQLTNSSRFIRTYEVILITATVSITMLYFFGISLNIYRLFLIPIGLTLGAFIGLLASALAEIINVIPVLVRRLKIRKHVYIALFSLSLGKVIGSLIYWFIMP